MKKNSGPDPKRQRGRPIDGRPHRSARLKADTPTVESGISPYSFVAERYRRLAVRILESLQRRKAGYLLVVTSPEPASGKTLTSLNLALTLAQLDDRRILLVECDLWKPNLSSYLDMEDRIPGFGQILYQEADLDESIVSIWGTGLHAMSAGPPRGTETLISDRRIGQVLAKLRPRYDIVVFDTPPVLLASGQTLASLADGVLLVVRAGRTKRKDIGDALSILEPAKLLGLLPNAVRKGELAASAYGAYAYYGSDQKSTPGEVSPSKKNGADLRPRLYDLLLSKAGAGSRALSGYRSRWSHWPPRWRLVLAGVALIIVAVLTAFFSIKGPWGDGAAPATGSERSVGAPEAGTPVSPAEGILPKQETSAEPTLDESHLPTAVGRTSVAAPLRSSPGLEHPVLKVLGAGSRIVILETEGDWLRVRDGSDREGWLLGALVEVESRIDAVEHTEGEPPL